MKNKALIIALLLTGCSMESSTPRLFSEIDGCKTYRKWSNWEFGFIYFTKCDKGVVIQHGKP